ncbi:class I SAM-dependent methyltransferase [Streptomyces sp. H27-H1]|uniref:class I SAM-dependent methyltransferase n=1 Tax=Streptomyces sp. H27-H1 TaxID=2996461 RepID=UPI002270E0F1|nr:class I SAM-dependent methyltransferase [Streptomyces sp. H27-H1]MCY0929074.1 class I SAM-dependent methyltransferase [Streptomyces sp. H27-H1]
MTTATHHYEHLLADEYTWMLGGDITSHVETQAALLRGLGVLPDGPAGDTAVDLGCGPGAQSLALAALGFRSVTAVDTSRRLLDELASYAGAPSPIRPVHADLRTALPQLAAPATLAAVVCMGDTLTHLPATTDVVALLSDVRDALAPGGHLVITYRDLTGPLTGTDRFLPVRSDENQILTCFLEYTDEDTVTVHDLLHTRIDGAWSLRAGSYPKLRLSAEWLAGQCRAANLDVVHDATGPRGLRVLHARRS